LGPLGTAATNRPIVPTPGDYDYGEIGGMMIGRGNRSTRRKPAPVPLFPTQTPHAARTRIRTAAVGSHRLNTYLALSLRPTHRSGRRTLQNISHCCNNTVGITFFMEIILFICTHFNISLMCGTIYPWGPCRQKVSVIFSSNGNSSAS
jgi:hypothetical protein